MTRDGSRASIAERARPEERLVFAAARAQLTDDATTALGPLVDDLSSDRDQDQDPDPDWDRFDRIVTRHHVRPLVYRLVLDEHAEAVPAGVADRWRSYLRTNVQRNLHLTGELDTVLERFEASDVPVLPFKGPVLAATAYDGVSMREFVDLDIIIDDEAFSRAKSTLRAAGYEIQHKSPTPGGLTATQEALLVEFGRETEFFRPSDRVHVDLHWRFLPRRSTFPVSFADISDRRGSVRVAGTELPTMSAEDTLLLLCVHGARHCWRHLRESCDVAALVDARRIDWGTVCDRAETLGCRRRLGVGLRLARDLFDAAVPGSVLARVADADPAVETLVDGAYDRLLGPIAGSKRRKLRYKYATHDTTRDRLSFLLRWLFYPNRKEIELVSLPDRLRPLYHLVRPARLLGESYDRLF